MMVDPWMLWGTDVWVDVIKAIKVLAHECTVGTDEVWMDVIMVLAHGCSGERNAVWVHVIMVLVHGCSGERMRSGQSYMVFPSMLLGKQETTRFFTCLLPCSSPYRPL